MLLSYSRSYRVPFFRSEWAWRFSWKRSKDVYCNKNRNTYKRQHTFVYLLETKVLQVLSYLSLMMDVSVEGEVSSIKKITTFNLYTSLYTYMYMFIYIHVHLYIHTCTCLYTYMYMTSLYTCTCMYMFVHHKYFNK